MNSSRSRPATVPADVLFLLLGDASGSSRALRQLRVMSEMGLRVEAVGVGAVRDTRAMPPGVRYTALAMPPGSGPRLFWAAHRMLRTAALSRPARIVHASDLHVLPAAAAAAKAHGARLAYDAREWYAGLDAAAGRPYVSWAWRAVEHRFAPRADVVFTVNDAIADRLAAERHIARPAVVRNTSDVGRWPRTGALRRLIDVADDVPLVLYQGLLRPGRGLVALIEATARVPDVHLVIIGEGSLDDELQALGARLAPGRTHHLPFTPPDALRTLTPDADLGALALEPLTESLRLALPNKLFEYAAADVPILAGAGIVPLRDAVETHGAGVVADPTDVPALADALRRGLDPAARPAFRDGLVRLRDTFRWEDDAARFRDAYASLLAP